MPDQAIGADSRWEAGCRMQYGAVLNVGAFSDPEPFVIAPRDSAEPDTDISADGDTTNDVRGRCDPKVAGLRKLPDENLRVHELA